MASVGSLSKLSSRVLFCNVPTIGVSGIKSTRNILRRQFSNRSSTLYGALPAYASIYDNFLKGNVVNTGYGLNQNGLPRQTVLYPYSTSVKEQSCWKCGAGIDPQERQYFCECGIVQPPLKNRNLFEVLGVEVGFVQNTDVLHQQFRDLQRLLHPDKFAQRSEKEKEMSLQQSSLVNKAYSTLSKPLPRAIYLLQLNGLSIEEDEVELDPAFLMEIMEMNEDLIECETDKCVRKVKDQNVSIMQDLLDKLTAAFDKGHYEQAKVLISKLKYYSNIEEKVKEKEHMML